MPRMWAKVRVATWVDLDLDVPERTFDPDNEAEVQDARRGAAVLAEQRAGELWPDADEIQVEEVSDRT